MRARAFWIGAAVVGIAEVAIAGPTREPPEASKAIVANAVAIVGQAYAGRARTPPGGAPGSLEAAIKGYVSTTVHALDEGRVPPPRAGSCPADMVKAHGAFCVDKYEGSLEELKDDGSRGAVDPYATLAPGRVYVARSVAGVVPQGYISAAQAEAACQKAQKRLCQAVEWRVACAGSNGTAYPYGPSRIADRCHDTGKSPMLAYHADTMARGWGLTELNDPRNNALEGGLEKTGARPGCVNDYGAFDMVGNLHEWTADPNGTFQGGYWLDVTQHGEGCAYRTVAHGYGYHDYSTGFRCCKDLDP